MEQGDPAERAATLTALGDVYLNEDEMSKAERAYADEPLGKNISRSSGVDATSSPSRI
jgi:hypothetical protein